ncbi:amidase [Hyaloraphidium curvatum]|nr:amidase [Hyaloraphidium curvatum]
MPRAPHLLSASEALAAFRAGALTPSALLDSCLARIRAANPAVNAFVALADEGSLRAEAAAKDAELADAIKRGTADTLPPLFGLPCGVKDLNDAKGLKTTYGSLMYADAAPAEKDCDPVARMREAGAIIVGKTNTPEFGAGANTRNLVFGATGNPFDTKLTTAGSSGGSAAAVSAFMCPLALGSDMGGSLRTPASFCSVLGLRPTPGLVPDLHKKSLLFSPLGVEGPMARTAEDLALFTSVIAAEDARDPLSWPGIRGAEMHPSKLPAVDLKKLKVGFSPDLGGMCAVDPLVREAFAGAVARLLPLFAPGSGDVSALLASVYALPTLNQTSPHVKTMHDVFSVLRAEHFLSRFDARNPANREKLSYPVAANIASAEGYAYHDRMAAHAHAALFFARWQEKVAGEYDIVVVPTATAPPFPHSEMWAPEEVDGKKMSSYFEWISITYLITLTQSPVVALPVGSYPPPLQNLPFGVQLVGRRRKDGELLAAARAIEAAIGGRMEPPV